MLSPGVNTAAADAYERRLVPGFLGPSAERVLELAAPRDGEAVLDVACGTGVALRLAARRARLGRAAGVDIDAAMLAVAVRASEEEGTHAQWHCASALELPFGAAIFDLCLCLQGLQFFPDRAEALREMRRVLRPGGRVVASAWGPPVASAAHQTMFDALARLGRDPTGPSRGFSLEDPETLAGAFREAGYAEVRVVVAPSKARFTSVEDFIEANVAGSVASRSALASLGAEERACLRDEMRLALSRYLASGALEWPVRTHVALASS